jgi:hypothetical protein
MLPISFCIAYVRLAGSSTVLSQFFFWQFKKKEKKSVGHASHWGVHRQRVTSL